MTVFGKNILILAPHPDDEIVAACGAIGRATSEGAKISVLFLTHGCIAKETLWTWQRKNYEDRIKQRRIEAEKAAFFSNLEIIGFSDRPARHLWKQLDLVYKEIDGALEKYKPDQLWIPAYEGGNADHDGLNGLCQHFRDRVKILEFAEYNFSDGKKQSQTFPDEDGTETTLYLTPKEQAQKRTALALYASEKNNLGYVDTLQESYRLLASCDYSKPPHEGKLWYARFQWVPFRHPRVDFTDPLAVCTALSLFEKTNALPELAKQ